MDLDSISKGKVRHSCRTRTVRLVRPTVGALPPPGFRYGPNLGFSIRGGREHGSGIFISQVEIGSEAHSQGLRPGDQIIRINGFTLDYAIHKEVLVLLSNYTHITLKVRYIGMIPFKEHATDSISWQILSDSDTPTQLEENRVVRIHIYVAPKSKLGCWICKGPVWKQGIFIQFTAEGGTARNAGLRPGDQILSCNNIDFSDITFNEAVNVMKSSNQLELIVRKSAGWDLFPGESSGYNSSSSSVAGDQSLSWSDSKRLLKLKEKSMDQLADGRPSQCQIAHSNGEIKSWDSEFAGIHKQIINLSENGSTITSTTSGTNNTIANENYKTESILKSTSSNHRSSPDSSDSSNGPTLNEKPKTIRFSNDVNVNNTTKVQLETTNNMTSAISQELLKIFEKRGVQNGSNDETPKRKSAIQDLSTKKQEQHSKLMNEFQVAHQKMFKQQVNEENQEKLEMNGSTKIDGAIFATKMGAKPFRNSYKLKNVRAPPPPPPLPRTDYSDNTIQINLKSRASDNFILDDAQSSNLRFSTFHQPPPSPSPDYDISIIS